jgi:hypothetical protein
MNGCDTPSHGSALPSDPSPFWAQTETETDTTLFTTSPHQGTKFGTDTPRTLPEFPQVSSTVSALTLPVRTSHQLPLAVRKIDWATRKFGH